MEWPNGHLDRSLEKDCALAKQYLPKHCDIDRSLLDRMRTGSTEKADEEPIARLLQTFVLVRLPPNYGHLEVVTAHR